MSRYQLEELMNCDKELSKLFHDAMRKSDLDVARRMLDAGADVNHFDNGYTPLHEAVRIGNILLVRLLLDHGADVSRGDSEGYTPVHYAAISCEIESYDICKLLLENGADCNDRYNIEKVTPFLFALRHINLEGIKLFMGHGADTTAVDSDGLTALHYSLLNPHMDVIKFVLDQGINIEGVSDGDSPLEFVIGSHKPEACEVLLRNGAMVNKRNSGLDSTPLLHAIMWSSASSNDAIIQVSLVYH